MLRDVSGVVLGASPAHARADNSVDRASQRLLMADLFIIDSPLMGWLFFTNPSSIDSEHPDSSSPVTVEVFMAGIDDDVLHKTCRACRTWGMVRVPGWTTG